MISDEVNLLVSKAKSRDADAFTTLILSIKEQLYKTIYVIVQNQSSALEVLDEVIYKSYINLNKLSHNEFFKTWIIRIAINESKNYIKKNSKIMYMDEYEEKVDFNISTTNELHEEKMDIEQAMKKLDQNTRTILVMKLYLENTFEDIAQNLEKPVSTVKSAYYTGIEKLRQLLRIEEVNE